MTLQQAVHSARQCKPDLVLLDMPLDTPVDSQIATLRSLLQARPGHTLILADGYRDDLLFQAMQLGVSGVLTKQCQTTQFCSAIRTILAGQVYLDGDAIAALFRVFHRQGSALPQLHPEVNLSERELEVLRRLVQGEPNADIARSLYITVATVKAHLTSIFDKLGVKSRSQAIVTALKLGLV